MKRFIKLALSVAILALLVWQAGLHNLMEALQQVNLMFVVPGVALYLFGQWVSAVRWQLLAQVLGFNAPRATYVDAYLLGMVCSLFLPGAIGGDAVRTVLLARQCGKRKREALLTFLAERGVGLVILLWLTTLASLAPIVQAHLPWPVLQGLWLASSSLILGWVALLVLPVERFAQQWPALNLIVQAKPYWTNPRVMAASLGLSMVMQLLMVIVHVGMAVAMGVFPTPLNLPFVVVAYGLAQLAGVLPIAFAGFGLREGAYQKILELAGLAPAQGLAYGLYWALILLATTAAAGLWLLLRRPDLLNWVRHTHAETGDETNQPNPPSTASTTATGIG